MTLRAGPAIAILLTAVFGFSSCDGSFGKPWGNPGSQPIPEPTEIPPDTEGGPAVKGLRGIGFWPFHDMDLDAAFAIFRQGAEIAYLQRKIFENNPGQFAIHDRWSDKAKAAGIRRFLAIEIFSGDTRTGLMVPEGWSGPAPDASNPAWRDAYRTKVAALAADYKPEYLCAAVEANMYYAAKPQDWANFKAAFEATKQAVKLVSPATRVFISYQYEYLIGHANKGKTQWELLTGEKLLDNDLLGISSYPLANAPGGYNPARVPEDYYAELTRRSPLKVFFAEMGWYSSSTVTPPSSLAGQALFVRKLRKILAPLNLEGYCWVSFLDPKRHAGVEDLFKYAPTIVSLGLLDPELRPKPAWAEWLALSSARAPSAAPSTIGGGPGAPAGAAPARRLDLNRFAGFGTTTSFAFDNSSGTPPGSARWKWSYNRAADGIAFFAGGEPALGGWNGLQVRVRSEKDTSCALVLIENGGGQYEHKFTLRAGDWKLLTMPWTAFSPQTSHPDANSKLDPADLKSMGVFDVSAAAGVRGANTILIEDFGEAPKP